jgi:hypothetical protein
MASAAQIAANRRNALKSTGPRTPEGKAVVAENALCHGLRSERAVIFDESAEELAAFGAGLRRALAPADEYEAALVDRIVHIEWRLRRAWRIEAAAIDDAAATADRERLAQRVAQSMDDEWVVKTNSLPSAAAKEAHRERIATWSDDRLRDYATEDGLAIEPPSPALWPAQLAAMARYEAALERQLHRATQTLERRQALRRDGEFETEAETAVAAPPVAAPKPIGKITEQSQFRPPLPLHAAAAALPLAPMPPPDAGLRGSEGRAASG